MKTYSIWRRKTPKFGQNWSKIGQNRSEIGQNRYVTYHDRSGQYLFMDFFDYRQKILRPISGRTGRARANLMPFLDFG